MIISPKAKRAISNVAEFIVDDDFDFIVLRCVSGRLEFIAFDRYVSIIDSCPYETESEEDEFDGFACAVCGDDIDKLKKFVGGVKDLKASPGAVEISLGEDSIILRDRATGVSLEVDVREVNLFVLSLIDTAFDNVDFAERVQEDFGILPDRLSRFFKLKPDVPGSPIVMRMCRNPIPTAKGNVVFMKFGTTIRIVLAGTDLVRNRSMVAGIHGEEVASQITW